MGRYDSPLSVVTLFLGATVVSVGLIFLFDAEAESRLVKDATTPKFPLPPVSLSYSSSSSSNGGGEGGDHKEKSVDKNEETSSVVGKDFPRADPENQLSSTTPGSSGFQFFIGYFRGRLQNLFKRHHTRVKRSIVDEEEEEDEEEDDSDIPSEPLALPLVSNPEPGETDKASTFESKSRNRRSRQKPDISVDPEYDPSNKNGDMWKSRSSDQYQASPSPVQTSSSAAASSSVGFHKIRHAMKKLGGGGLDLSMVERMILDPNPSRFRASTENQEQQQPNGRKSNYHSSSPGGGGGGGGVGNNGFPHDNDGQKSTKLGTRDNFDPYYQSQLSGQSSSSSGSHDQDMNSGSSGGLSPWDNPGSSAINPNYKSQSGGRKRKGGAKSSSSSSSDNNNEDDEDNNVNENSNSFEPERRRASSTSTTILPFPSSSSTSGNGRSQRKGNRQKKKSSSSFVVAISSPPPPPPSSPSLAVMEDSLSDSVESSDFDGETEGKVEDGSSRRRGSGGGGKSNHANSRLGSTVRPASLALDEDVGENIGSQRRRPSSRRDDIQVEGGEEEERRVQDVIPPHNKQQQNYKHVDSSQTHHHRPIILSENDEDLEDGGEGGKGLDKEDKGYVVTDTKKSILKQVHVDPCYKTDDVLIVVAITCCLNFAFVLVVWGCVRWFSISAGSAKERDFHHLDCEDGGDSILFHEEQDHEDCCWRASSPLGHFRRGGGGTIGGDKHHHPPLFDSGRDGLDLENINCRQHRHCTGGRKSSILGNCNDGLGGSSCDDKKLSPGSKGSGLFPPSSASALFPSFHRGDDSFLRMNVSSTGGPGGRGGSGMGGGCGGNENAGFRASLRRKPSDRFHFFQQKQYQKNLKEFGLGFGPSFTTTTSNGGRGGDESSSHKHPPTSRPRLPNTSASLYSFQVSDVPTEQETHHHQVHQHLRSTKSYSQSMEDLRYIHT